MGNFYLHWNELKFSGFVSFNTLHSCQFKFSVNACRFWNFFFLHCINLLDILYSVYSHSVHFSCNVCIMPHSTNNVENMYLGEKLYDGPEHGMKIENHKLNLYKGGKQN